MTARTPLLSSPRVETVSQCHSEEWSDEESAFGLQYRKTNARFGRKADPSLGLRMTRLRFLAIAIQSRERLKL